MISSALDPAITIPELRLRLLRQARRMCRGTRAPNNIRIPIAAPPWSIKRLAAIGCHISASGPALSASATSHAAPVTNSAERNPYRVLRNTGSSRKAFFLKPSGRRAGAAVRQHQHGARTIPIEQRRRIRALDHDNLCQAIRHDTSGSRYRGAGGCRDGFLGMWINDGAIGDTRCLEQVDATTAGC